MHSRDPRDPDARGIFGDADEVLDSQVHRAVPSYGLLERKCSGVHETE